MAKTSIQITSNQMTWFENCIHFSTFISRVLIKFHAFEMKTLMMFCAFHWFREFQKGKKKNFFSHEYQNLNLNSKSKMKVHWNDTGKCQTSAKNIGIAKNVLQERLKNAIVDFSSIGSDDIFPFILLCYSLNVVCKSEMKSFYLSASFT